MTNMDSTHKRTQAWWDDWFIGLAEYTSSASKDVSTMN